jgi:hypothetical protein
METKDALITGYVLSWTQISQRILHMFLQKSTLKARIQGATCRAGGIYANQAVRIPAPRVLNGPEIAG